MTHSTVADVMSEPVVWVGPRLPYAEIVRTMSDAEIGAVPVLDDHWTLLGLVSESDLLAKVALADEAATAPLVESPRHRRTRRRAAGDTAADLMSAPVITADPGESVVAAAKRMARHRIKHLPVVDEAGRVVGMVARADLLRVYLRSDTQIRDEIATTVVRDVLLCSPDEVRVSVAEGVVTLTGEVEFRSLVPVALRLARSVDGVVDVVDELTYRTDDSHPRHPYAFGPPM